MVIRHGARAQTSDAAFRVEVRFFLVENYPSKTSFMRSTKTFRIPPADRGMHRPSWLRLELIE
jgi:hypothetical protein